MQTQPSHLKLKFMKGWRLFNNNLLFAPQSILYFFTQFISLESDLNTSFLCFIYSDKY